MFHAFVSSSLVYTSDINLVLLALLHFSYKCLLKESI